VTNGLMLNDLIEAALRQQPYNQPRLGREAQRYCDAITARLGADLPEDLHEDVFQEAFSGLFEEGAIAALATKSGKAFFRSLILNAIRSTRAAYAPPGARTRKAAKTAPPEKVAAEDVGRSVTPADIARCTMLGDDGPFIDFDRFESASAAAEFQQVEDRIDGERLLAAAPPDVAAMLRLICIDGERVDETTERFGIDRFAYYRAVTNFRAKLVAA